MSLESVYSNQVKKKSLGGMSVPIGSLIERDPTISELERNIFEKIREISPPEEPTYSKKSLEVRTFSVEDAIKELIEMSKKTSN
jgi:hypothetical protein